jgi:hypothetical protein
MTHLITAAEVVALAFTDTNLTTGLIKDSFIEIAEQQYIRPALGDKFFAALRASAPAGDNKTFDDNYLKIALAFFVKYVAMPDLAMKITGAGVAISQPGGTVTPTDKQREGVSQAAMDGAQTLLKAAIDYLDNNLSLYPLYATAMDDGETTPAGVTVKGGIIL